MGAFIDKVRASDNRTKFKYVVLFSGLAGIVVFAVWAISVRGIIEEAAAGDLGAQGPDSSYKDSLVGAWNGLKERTVNTVEFFSDLFSDKNEITIEK